MVESDPFEILFLPGDATRSEVEAARRRLARSLHPDLGGDATAMQRVNRAADLALESIARRPIDSGRQHPHSQQRWPDPGCADRSSPLDSGSPESRPATAASRHGTLFHDAPSFVIEALPAVAHEALLMVARTLGDVIEDDPPYVLEAVVDDQVGRIWCRLEILPEAGSSSVSLSVATLLDDHSAGMVEIERVRDRWITGLNHLDWSELS